MYWPGEVESFSQHESRMNIQHLNTSQGLPVCADKHNDIAGGCWQSLHKACSEWQLCECLQLVIVASLPPASAALAPSQEGEVLVFGSGLGRWTWKCNFIGVTALPFLSRLLIWPCGVGGAKKRGSRWSHSWSAADERQRVDPGCPMAVVQRMDWQTGGPVLRTSPPVPCSLTSHLAVCEKVVLFA
jgi:hypothetical protein